MVETVGMVLDRIERKASMAVELPPNATSLDLLRAIYRNPHAELTMRIRCAMACLQFEHAKLGVTVQGNTLNGGRGHAKYILTVRDLIS